MTETQHILLALFGTGGILLITEPTNALAFFAGYGVIRIYDNWVLSRKSAK